MKLFQDVHLQAVSKIHERYINRSTTKGVIFVQGMRDRTRGLDQ